MSWFRRTPSRNLIAKSLLLGAWFLASPASATVFLFQQTAGPPGIFVDSLISVDGNLSNLPTVASTDVPISFGNLHDFDISLPVPDTRGHYTLGDFKPTCLSGINCQLGLPVWSVSPQGINLLTFETQFAIQGFGGNSTISFRSDAGASPNVCGFFTDCVVEGNWIATSIPSNVEANIYFFHETFESAPIDAVIAINGNFGSLPTLDSHSVSSPVDFGNLLAFDIITPGRDLTLTDFVPACSSFDPSVCIFGYPDWQISPAGIFFNDTIDITFFIEGFGHNSTITVSTDRPECFQIGSCLATGDWILATVPEPSSITLIMASLAGLCLIWRRQDRSLLSSAATIG